MPCCCHTPNIGHVIWVHLHTENLSKSTCLAVNVAFPPNLETFLYEAFQTVSTVTNRNEMWRRQFSLSSCSDRALCLVSLSHWLMPLYQQPATQEILESLSTHHYPLFCGSIFFNSCHNCTYTSQIRSFFTMVSRYPILTCFILNPLIIRLCGSSYSVTLENE